MTSKPCSHFVSIKVVDCALIGTKRQVIISPMAKERSLNGLCAGKLLYILGEMHIRNQCQTSVAFQENMLFRVLYIQHLIDTHFTQVCILWYIFFHHL